MSGTWLKRQGGKRVTSRFGGRLAVSISPSDVGRRITVRRVEAGGFRDAVGVLVAWRDGVLQVRKRDGTMVEIPEHTVAAAKVVPDR